MNVRLMKMVEETNGQESSKAFAERKREMYAKERMNQQKIKLAKDAYANS